MLLVYPKVPVHLHSIAGILGLYGSIVGLYTANSASKEKFV